MANGRRTVTAERAYYIKLGRGGEWEVECLREGSLRFGYRETPHDLCLAGEWDQVRNFWAEQRTDPGAAARDAKQIRAFYETDESGIFITFANGLLHWCRPTGPVEVLPDGNHRRATVDGWHHQSANGTLLSSERISGHLLKVQMFRGTICQVKPFDYLLRKLNDELSPEVTAAEEAESALMEATVRLMRLLTWQDFELLVDSIFSASGWRRIGVIGRVQKTVDLNWFCQQLESVLSCKSNPRRATRACKTMLAGSNRRSSTTACSSSGIPARLPRRTPSTVSPLSVPRACPA